MAASNGHAKTANGSSYTNGNGVSNGKPNGTMNGKPIVRRRAGTKQRGFVASTFSTVARLTTWATILTVLFRCPSTLEACDETSAYVCKPYFQVKNAVVPHAQPYYDQYAAPYVDVARPYYNAVDNTVFTPTRKYAVQYGGPWAEKAQGYALEQWKVNGEPTVTQLRGASQARYEQSVAPLLEQANQVVGPYYDIARTNGLQAYYEYLLPSYQYLQPYAVQGYGAASEFAAYSALPAAYWTWNKTYVFLDTAVWPQIKVLYLENVEPQLVRIGERLGRYKTKAQQSTVFESVPDPSDIKESVASSFNKPSSQQVSESTTSSSTEKPLATEAAHIVDNGDDDYYLPVQAPPAAENESDKRKTAREMVAEDLETWQKKFAAAADEGAVDMEERVSEIAAKVIAEDVQVTGKGLADGLTKTVESQIEILKSKISEIVASDEWDGADAEEEVTRAVRAAGVAIKDQAQALRQWREKFDKNLQNTVIEAADVHFQILDETRSLALQKIGMRWAWTDGVTWKDWAKYHELKRTLGEWTEQLKQLIVSNPALIEAQDAAAQVEDDAMDVAGSAAKELIRLKDVAHYKIVANDATDNFEQEALKAAAEAAIAAKAAERAAAQSAQDAAIQASEAAAEKAKQAASAVSESVEDATASIADAVEEQSTAASQSASSILSEGEEATSEVGEELSSSSADAASAVSSGAEAVASSASSIAAAGTDSVKSVADDVSAAVVEASSEASVSGSSAASEASSEASQEFEDDESEAAAAATALVSEASEVLVGQTQSIVANLTEDTAEDVPEQIPEDVTEQIPEEVEEDPLAARDETPLDAGTDHVKPAFLGAAAQAVPERQVVLEDYVDTDVIESATNAAANAYSTALSKAQEQYSSAVSVVSAQIYGTPKPVHEQLLASVSAAYDFARAAASTKYEQALGTPTPTAAPARVDWSKVEDIAASRLSEGRLWAELQYQSAVIALGLAQPTASSVPEKYLQEAKRNYFAGLGVAQDRYSSFLNAASSVMSSMTAEPTPTNLYGSATAAAAAARESAESIARLAEEAVESAYSAAGDTVASVANAVDESIAGVVDGVTEQAYLAGAAFAETWDNAIAQISGQVYEDQKHIGWYDSLFSDAGSYVSSATDKIADGASAASDKAGDSAATASAEAAKQYDAVSQLVSELISGKEPTFTESVISRLSAAYATAAAGFESYASEASAAAASVGEKVGSAASQATEAIKEKAHDEL